MKYLFIALIFMILAGCGSPGWEFNREIKLTDITPLGIVVTGQGLWVSDVVGNQVVLLDLNGKPLKAFGPFERPMHIAHHNNITYVPEYTNDSIKVINNAAIASIILPQILDGPASIAVNDSALAIADFYNNRILLKKSGQITILGKEGHGAGELYYPTDVTFHAGKIYVADAYNNRVQVFDGSGQSIQMIGSGDDIQVATGIAISEQSVFVTDFEGSRILVYDLNGTLRDILYNNLNKPTDLAVYQNKLYIANYGGNSILEFVRN